MGQRIGVVARQGFLAEHLEDQLSRAGYEPVLIQTPATGTEGSPRAGRSQKGAGPAEHSWDGLRRSLEGCACAHYAGLGDEDQTRGSSARRASHKGAWRSHRSVEVLRAALEAGVPRVIISGSCRSRQGKAGRSANEDDAIDTARSTHDSSIRRLALEERAATKFARSAGLELVMVLAGHLIGPGDRSSGGLGSALVGRLNGRPSSSFGVEGTFSVVDVRDVARAHVAATEKDAPSSAYLVVAQTISALEWAGLFSRVTGLPMDNRMIRASLAMPVAAAMEAVGQMIGVRSWLDRDAVRQVREPQRYDCSRVRRELGLRFTPLEASVRDAVAWFARNAWISDESRLAIVQAALARAADDAALPRLEQHAGMIAAR